MGALLMIGGGGWRRSAVGTAGGFLTLAAFLLVFHASREDTPGILEGSDSNDEAGENSELVEVPADIVSQAMSIATSVNVRSLSIDGISRGYVPAGVAEGLTSTKITPAPPLPTISTVEVAPVHDGGDLSHIANDPNSMQKLTLGVLSEGSATPGRDGDPLAGLTIDDILSRTDSDLALVSSVDGDTVAGDNVKEALAIAAAAPKVAKEQKTEEDIRVMKEKHITKRMHSAAQTAKK